MKTSRKPRRFNVECSSNWPQGFDEAGRPAGRPYTRGAGMGTRIFRRWPGATSLGGSSTVATCGTGSAEPQAERLSPRLLLPSP